MTKKIERKVTDNVRISDSVEARVIRGIIIPAKFTNESLEVNYFVPRFKKIVKGEDVRWVNQDSVNHHLKFYEVSDDNVKFLFDLGVISPNAEIIKNFNFDNRRIDYICALHKNEIGTIIIYPKPEDQMTNTEQFRFLSKIFDITPPSILSHLRSS